MKSRDHEIVRASVVNIVSNVVLTIFKMVVGLMSNSVAIAVDAVNSFSDALSSVVSQVEEAAREVAGVRLASGVVLQDHGYDRLHGSLYITVDGSMSVTEFDRVALR